jgi:hypothetical protein
MLMLINTSGMQQLRRGATVMLACVQWLYLQSVNVV